MNSFEFEQGQKAIIYATGESGQIIARAEYLYNENLYLLRYKAADGRAVEEWWAVSALIEGQIL